MENIYAALLLHKASKEITEANLEKVLKAAGITADKNQLKMIVAGLADKNLNELIANAATIPAAPAAAAAPAEEKKEKKKKEKKEEKKEEEITGIGALFG
ncbi:MAG: 50S ribosomal protein P1 [Promethearchaeota archaeon]